MIRITMLLFLLNNYACTEKILDPDDPQKSFAVAKEPFDKENYEFALKKLGEFKARFPYSQYAAESELLIADAHFQLDQFDEAVEAYNRFFTLHPKHVKAPYALFQIGKAYWADAPSVISREQATTQKAVTAWENLIKKFPQSEFNKQAIELIASGKLRIAQSEEFAAQFYCKKEIWHACAYRYLLIKERYPHYPDLYKNAVEKAAVALEKMLEDSEKNEKDPQNVYFKEYSRAELHSMVQKLKTEAE